MSDTPIHVRAFGSDIESKGDGRTLEGLAVPFGVEARVSDGGPSYLERFQQGSFTRTIRERADRVKVLVQHDLKALPIGRAVALIETPEGLRCQLRLSKTQAADEALELLRDGALDGLSVGFQPVKHRNEGGVTVREEVKLREISICSWPSFSEARVQAIRSASGLSIQRNRLALARARLILTIDESE